MGFIVTAIMPKPLSLPPNYVVHDENKLANLSLLIINYYNCTIFQVFNFLIWLSIFCVNSTNEPNEKISVSIVVYGLVSCNNIYD